MSTVWTPHTRIGIMKTIMNHSWIKSLAYKYGKKHTCNCINSNQFQRSKIVKNTPPLESIEKLQRYWMFTKVWKQQETSPMVFQSFLGFTWMDVIALDISWTPFRVNGRLWLKRRGSIRQPPSASCPTLTRCTWITLLHPDKVHLVLNN